MSFVPVLGYGVRIQACNALITLILSACAAAAEPVTVVALGDSLTAGYGLPEGEGFVPQLQAWLSARGEDAQVINAGVSGDTTAGGLSRLDWSLTPETDALIVALGGNDLLRGLDPTITRSNLDAILAKAQARDLPVLLIGLPGPANYGAKWKTEFDAIFPELSRKYGTLMQPNFLAGLGGTKLEEMRPFMQPDGIHPSARGVDQIVANLGPSVQALIAEARP